MLKHFALSKMFKFIKMFLHNYFFHGLTRLFSDMYPVKFLATSAKLFHFFRIITLTLGTLIR